MRTVRVPEVAGEAHGGRHERIVARELELGGENAAFVGGALGALDEGFPGEQVVFVDGAGGDAVGGVFGEVPVFLEQAFGGDGMHRGGGSGEPIECFSSHFSPAAAGVIIIQRRVAIHSEAGRPASRFVVRTASRPHLTFPHPSSPVGDKSNSAPLRGVA